MMTPAGSADERAVADAARLIADLGRLARRLDFRFVAAALLTPVIDQLTDAWASAATASPLAGLWFARQAIARAAPAAGYEPPVFETLDLTGTAANTMAGDARSLPSASAAL